jgi:hypothetical protein
MHGGFIHLELELQEADQRPVPGHDGGSLGAVRLPIAASFIKVRPQDARVLNVGSMLD